MEEGQAQVGQHLVARLLCRFKTSVVHLGVFERVGGEWVNVLVNAGVSELMGKRHDNLQYNTKQYNSIQFKYEY